jgi:S-adenosylmethionine decarboxylase
MFGPHLMLDCYGCDPAKLDDTAYILKFLECMPARIGMTKIGGPYLLDCPGNTQTWDRGGVSAIVIIAESHISIHTFPGNGGYMSIDIFSCKEFDIDEAVELIVNEFSPTKLEKRLVMRGREFPKEQYKAMTACGAQRGGLRPSVLKASPPKLAHAEPQAVQGLDG